MGHTFFRISIFLFVAAQCAGASEGGGMFPSFGEKTAAEFFKGFSVELMALDCIESGPLPVVLSAGSPESEQRLAGQFITSLGYEMMMFLSLDERRSGVDEGTQDEILSPLIHALRANNLADACQAMEGVEEKIVLAADEEAVKGVARDKQKKKLEKSRASRVLCVASEETTAPAEVDEGFPAIFFHIINACRCKIALLQREKDPDGALRTAQEAATLYLSCGAQLLADAWGGDLEKKFKWNRYVRAFEYDFIVCNRTKAHFPSLPHSLSLFRSAVRMPDDFISGVSFSAGVGRSEGGSPDAADVLALYELSPVRELKKTRDDEKECLARAGRGDVEAMKTLGWLYFMGYPLKTSLWYCRIIEKDYKKAVMWLTRGVEAYRKKGENEDQGHLCLMLLLLARIYREGGRGIVKNLYTARSWAEEAVAVEGCEMAESAQALLEDIRRKIEPCRFLEKLKSLRK